MARRWSWDFEDDRPLRADSSAQRARTEAPARRARTEAPAQTTRPAPPSRGEAGAAKIRRRRGLAVLVVLLILALAISSLAGGSHHTTSRPSNDRHASLSPRSAAKATAAPAESRAEGEAAVRSVLAYTPFVKQGGTRGRDVALTFDDGPGPYTPQVLAVLERFQVRATFFEVGRLMRYFGGATEQQVADGDWVEDHTENHSPLATLNGHDQREELFEQIARVELLDGPRPVLFRPPFGSFNQTTIKTLHALHLLMVLWSVDTQDYRRPGVSVIVQRALEGVEPGAIILMHDAGGNREQTVAALPAIIRGVRERGYRLVTVPQLLRDDPPPRGQPLPPNLSGD